MKCIISKKYKTSSAFLKYSSRLVNVEMSEKEKSKKVHKPENEDNIPITKKVVPNNFIHAERRER